MPGEQAHQRNTPHDDPVGYRPIPADDIEQAQLDAQARYWDQLAARRRLVPGREAPAPPDPCPPALQPARDALCRALGIGERLGRYLTQLEQRIAALEDRGATKE